MKIKKLNFESFEEARQIADILLCFIRPLGSKLLRLYYLPEEYKNHKELLQVLNTLCLAHKPINGIYYFRVETPDDLCDILSPLALMDIPNTCMEQNLQSPLDILDPSSLN